jgi:hypothetical protein
VKPESSGIIFGAFSVCGTLGTMLITKLGGYLYDRVLHYWPFILTLGFYGVLTLAGLVLGLRRQLQ